MKNGVGEGVKKGVKKKVKSSVKKTVKNGVGMRATDWYVVRWCDAANGAAHTDYYAWPNSVFSMSRVQSPTRST